MGIQLMQKYSWLEKNVWKWSSNVLSDDWEQASGGSEWFVLNNITSLDELWLSEERKDSVCVRKYWICWEAALLREFTWVFNMSCRGDDDREAILLCNPPNPPLISSDAPVDRDVNSELCS